MLTNTNVAAGVSIFFYDLIEAQNCFLSPVNQLVSTGSILARGELLAPSIPLGTHIVRLCDG